MLECLAEADDYCEDCPPLSEIAHQNKQRCVDCLQGCARNRTGLRFIKPQKSYFFFLAKGQDSMLMQLYTDAKTVTCKPVDSMSQDL